MTFPRSRTLFALLLVTLAGALVAPAASHAAKRPGSSAAAAKKKHRLAPRKGGHIRKAWPVKRSHGRSGRGGRPNRLLARFLAKQVGPAPGTKHLKAAASSSGAGPLLDFLPTGKPGSLRLVRSFDVPTDDPAAARMANLSWTYDSAVAAVALMFAGEKAQAEQLLDQLAAVQRTDGSIDFAFNVADGSSLQQFRSGSIAWIGLAAATYRNLYHSTRYGTLAGGAARYVLARRQSTGLVAGGPDVSWVSTQHNLLTWFFLNSLDSNVVTGLSSSDLDKAKDTMAAAIESKLIVSVDSTHSAFVQGINDASRPLDVQALGLLFLEASGRGQSGHPSTEDKVRAYLGSAYAVSGRSIVKSSVPASFNQTYAAAGPFSGYKPYAEVSSPNVIWAEGTAEVRFALKARGESTTTLDNSITSWGAVTTPRGEGPLGADRTDTGQEINEYHVWPSSAAASWTLLGSASAIWGI
jgi:hypothetical protein